MQMRNYVLGLVGLLGLFFATFPVAYWRVSHSEPFSGAPFKSVALETEAAKLSQQQ